MAFSVIFGAFGSHGLKELVSEKELNTWETGVKYQMIHALALIVLGISHRRFAEKTLNFALYLFIGGIFIFSGSLYLLATRNIWGNESFAVIGAITPLGGLSFIVGWFALFFRGFEPDKDNGGIDKDEKDSKEDGEKRRHRRHRSHSSEKQDLE